MSNLVNPPTSLEVFLSQYWPNFAGTVTGGIILSLLFFFLREWLFSLPRLTGVWICELLTAKTAYKPYAGMKLRYKVTLIQNGDQILGYGELDSEDSTRGSRQYEGPGRRPISISGRVEKNIFRSDRIQLLWSEKGELRTFSNVLDLKVSGSKADCNLWGTFSSTAAGSSGNSAWTRVR